MLFVRVQNFTKNSSTIEFKLIMCVIITLLSGFFVWYILGWFYNLRIKWSGAINHDKTEGRITMIYISFIEICLITCIFFFPSISLRISYILIDGYFKILNYSAVKSKFSIQGIKPIFWFLIIPITLQISYPVFIYTILNN
jgi:hypothetical protein